MIKIFMADRAFTPWYVRAVRWIMFAVAIVATVVAIKSEDSIIILAIMSLIFLMAECLLDHSAYGGINNRKLSGMNLLRSSAKGIKTINLAITQDIIFSGLRTVAELGIPFLIMFFGQENTNFGTLCLGFTAIVSVIFGCLLVFKLISRMLAVEIQTYVFLASLMLMILTVIVMMVTFFQVSIESVEGLIMLDGIIIVIAAAVDVILVIWVKREAKMGFLSGYSDRI